MSRLDFGLTWDYRCPFARNLAEHVVVGLLDGADWRVRFLPFSLNQTKVGDGRPDVWDDDALASTRLAVEAGIAVRDHWPERFPRVHLALFAARHDQGRDLRDRAVVAAVLGACGLDAEAVLGEVDGGGPRETFRREHRDAVATHEVFGVPTVIADGRAVFVRVMNRPDGDPAVAHDTVERLLDLVGGWPELNELKHTTIAR